MTYDNVLLGSGAECDVILPHSSIARQHARVKRRKQGYVLFDLKSTHGTYVNGRRIVENLLKDGWVVRLGEVEFVFHGVTALCSACGTQNREQAHFCGYCGRPLQRPLLEPAAEAKKTPALASLMTFCAVFISLSPSALAGG